ncbi:putative dual specificity protein kinase YAK1 [Cardamine amara subsp. amara]|uniref:Dual specificity protein kinase YAK1 n=1 Tax=Cardamine amara subsp. amara TaxID=228776 RepID=A0ABD1A9D1_CARAN
MEDSSSVDSILEFLRRNRFMRAEAALISELSNNQSSNGSLKKLNFESNGVSKLLDKKKQGGSSRALGLQNDSYISDELVVKEIQCGAASNLYESNHMNDVSVQTQSGNGADFWEERFTFSEGLVDTELDLPPWNHTSADIVADSEVYSIDPSKGSFLNPRRSKQSSHEKDKSSKMVVEDIFSPFEKIRTGSSSQVSQYDHGKACQSLEVDNKVGNSAIQDGFITTSWSRTDESIGASSDNWKDCSVTTVFPLSKGSTSKNDSGAPVLDKRQGKKKIGTSDSRTVIKEQEDDVATAMYLGKSQSGYEDMNLSSLAFSLAHDGPREDLPRLPHVKIKSEDKSMNFTWEEKHERDILDEKLINTENAFLIGSYLDVPIGQEINSSGGKIAGGGNWLSVSQGIAEDASDLILGFGNGLGDITEHSNEYWDSDEYDDDDDVGYIRQPIEDEAWFLGHEVDYPSDNEKGTEHESVPDTQDKSQTKNDDDHSFAEEDSYFSGEQYVLAKGIEPVTASDDPMGLSMTETYSRTKEPDLAARYDGELMDAEELSLMHTEPVWQGFVNHENDLILLNKGKVEDNCDRLCPKDIRAEDDRNAAVRSIGVGMSDDVDENGSIVPDFFPGEGSEWDLELLPHHRVGVAGIKPPPGKGANMQLKSFANGGFSFPSSVPDGQMSHVYSTNPEWSNPCNAAVRNESDGPKRLIESDSMLVASTKRRSGSSSERNLRDRDGEKVVSSRNSSPSALSHSSYTGRERKEEDEEETSHGAEEDPGTSFEDEDAIVVQEQVRQIQAQEQEFETFNLKIVHRKNRTGFEEDKSFHVVLNSVIAGRYHVTEHLGSAAFSKAIQAHDLHTGIDVCVKIIKNNKDFFDQSLDEIKLLKYVNQHDPADKYHILRLYDYFYFREHLLIVCELLKANLYEFQKFNRESGGEVYFTMPRLQSITMQCLEALHFLHGLGLIHCDLKPENILIKSYSRCEIKVIDLGSSCFETDHLCSYVQSRSYRAPEVILGLPYDKKIDIWSLGCILAELCTGNVLFQNDSPATLLARVIGIIGSIDQQMLAKGRDTCKYFTKNHLLYERNQESNNLEYLIPKKSSLRRRLPMGDQGFIDFVGYLLQVDPKKRPSASEALKHPWLTYPYEPISP